jgi:hypothetical protein
MGRWPNTSVRAIGNKPTHPSLIDDRRAGLQAVQLPESDYLLDRRKWGIRRSSTSQHILLNTGRLGKVACFYLD